MNSFSKNNHAVRYPVVSKMRGFASFCKTISTITCVKYFPSVNN
jgi:hypothetical protein